MRLGARSRWVAVVVGTLLAGACARAPDHAPVVIFAAASTAPVVDQVVTHAQAEHPGVDVSVTYGGSADLAAQILEGAPAAVFVSANEAQMATVADHPDVGVPQVFATNYLVIAVPAGNPGNVTGLADLERDDLTSIVCAPQVPCGAATAELAALNGLTLAPASQENSVTDVLGKVTSGQADAGVVYLSDVARANGVEKVAMSDAERVLNHYLVATIDGDHDATAAQTFMTTLLGDDGRSALVDAGFGVPQ